tara:strand:+ start:304 stop:495 length:192 start_codon:yes stop_codon:yes gene_type:complete
MAFKDIMSKVGNVVKGAAGSGMLGPVGMLAGKLFKEGGKVKYSSSKKRKKKGGRRDMFTQQYD